MSKSRLSTLVLAAAFAMLLGGMTQAHGKVVFEDKIYSPVLHTNRMVRIYLPPSYESAPKRRYPVLYVHDGQNAFSTVGDQVAFGWGNWQLDRTVDRLTSEGRMREIIMVAVDCSSQRYQDYRGPSRAEAGAEWGTGSGAATNRFDRYRRFLIEDLKPRIDREYRTLSDAAHTGVLGSSMGGICSLALAWRNPEVFGLAASLSGAFQVEKRLFLEEVLGKHRGGTKPCKIYLDSGVCDYSGGDDGRRDSQEVADQLRRIGWRDGVDLRHHIDGVPLDEVGMEAHGLPKWKWGEAKTSQHNEFYWRVRAWRALEFLFPPESRKAR